MHACGIILAGGSNNKLGSLIKTRTNSAMPVACSYRAIDFALSNMSNSGINKIAVVTQYNSRSLNDHINSSKWWNIGRKNSGIFVFTPYATDHNQPWYRGTADSIYQNLNFLERSHNKYVVIVNGDGIYKMDYNDIINSHINNNADITVAVKEFQEDEVDATKYGNVIVDENNNILEFEEKPLEKISNTLSIGVYVMERELLIDLVKTVVSEGRFDFVNDIVLRYRRHMKLSAYKFNDYWMALNSVNSYFEISKLFLNNDFRDSMFNTFPYIMTKNKDVPPAKYNYKATVKNSLIGNGCIIDGHVEGSTLFRSVKIGENAIVKNCIIMEGSVVGEDCHLEYVIIDKNVKISNFTKYIGSEDDIKILDKNRKV
ncbi:MAG: glucose-1-phosphate adenylyltransferase subunit GlgD [Lachnospirales bacterium]